MTHALVTQLVEALEYVVDQGGGPLCEHEAGICFCKENTAITAAREYLATEPSGERAELIERLRDYEEYDNNKQAMSDAADMLEADAQQATDPSCPSCQSPGLMYECVYCSANSYPKGFVQQAKRVPMTEKQIDKIYADTARLAQIRTTFFVSFARAIEAHRGITPADKPTDWSAA